MSFESMNEQPAQPAELMEEDAVIEQVRQAMLLAGLDAPEDLVADGDVQRFHCEGDKPGSKDAWYVINPEVPQAFFGHWARLETQRWQLGGVSGLSPEQKRQIDEKVARVKAQRQVEQARRRETCQERAASLWQIGSGDVDSHAYLVKKGVRGYGLRQNRGGYLMVPIHTPDGALVSLQIITEEGSKTFLTGTPKKGNLFLIEGQVPGPVLVCEGYATGASLHAATGLAVAVAFDAGNLGEVCRGLRERLPAGTPLIICADDDRGGEVNTGQAKASLAAFDVGAYMVSPRFPEGDEGTDFNDMHQRQGLEAVRAVVMEAVARAMASPAPASAAVPAVLALEDMSPEQCLDYLAGLSGLELLLRTKDVASLLKVSVTDIKKLVQEKKADALRERIAQPEEAGPDAGMFEVVEPWPEPVDAASLLDEIVALVHRFIVIPEPTARAVALWIAFAWLIDEVQVAPIAMITAPEKRCGKTQLLSLLSLLCPRPLQVANITPAAIFRCVEAWKPTLLIDEADAFLAGSEDARGILNSGHTRQSAFVVRNVERGGEQIPTKFSTWGAKAISGIGKQAETLQDRSIPLVLRRKLPHETTEKLRRTDPAVFLRLRRKLCRLAEDAAESIRTATPEEVPGLTSDRAQDNWEPLLAIADYAAGHWPTTARNTAVALQGADEADSIGLNEMLLRDIRTVFQSKGMTRLFSSVLLEGLCEDDEAPWATFNRGQPLKAAQLAKRLRGFGLKSQSVRAMGQYGKGYKLEDFEEAFARYLPEPLEGAGATPSEPSHRHNPDGERDTANVDPESSVDPQACRFSL